MTEENWFENEFKMVEAFSCEATPLVLKAEAYTKLIISLQEEMASLEKEVLVTYQIKIKKHTAEYTLATLKEEKSKLVGQLKQMKEQYMQEELVDILEALTSAEEGLEVSDDACKLMKRISDLERQEQIQI